MQYTDKDRRRWAGEALIRIVALDTRVNPLLFRATWAALAFVCLGLITAYVLLLLLSGWALTTLGAAGVVLVAAECGAGYWLSRFSRKYPDHFAASQACAYAATFEGVHSKLHNGWVQVKPGLFETEHDGLTWWMQIQPEITFRVVQQIRGLDKTMHSSPDLTRLARDVANIRLANYPGISTGLTVVDQADPASASTA